MPDARIVISLDANPCARARRERAALVTIVPAAARARVRERALDCGVALFQDERGLVIAPR
ncbi:MAG: hypothetical protein NVS2B3_19570 [Vulcanimicrobiaceae bacterium]